MLDSDRIDCIDLMLPFLLLHLLSLLLPLRMRPIHDRRFAFDVFIVLKAQEITSECSFTRLARNKNVLL